MRNNTITIEGIHYKDDIGVKLIVENGFIQAIEPSVVTDSTVYIAPGFVDLQVNGYKGVDFNSLELTELDIVRVIESLLEQGVTSFYPTVITNSYEKISKLVQVISDAVEKNPLVRKMVPGIHLEGPFLSLEDGPRGAHAKECIQAPDWEYFQGLIESVNGLIKVITLSPEWSNAPKFIEKAAAQGICVSIGHTSATSEQIFQAVEAGASLSTHLGNGAHVMLPRHPNYLWDQLAEDRLAATVIADGFHLPDSVLKVIARVKKDKMVLISDSVALAGLPPGDYQASVGGEVTLTEEGRLHLKGEPRLLAGSAQSILWGVNQLVNMGITALSDAIDKASILPARIVDLQQKSGLQVGAPADLLLYKYKNNRVEVTGTMKAGEFLYHRSE
ncbi:amidohydrolase family protein [Robertmurraya massiliosenegalensis]|uniref:N-acetylglucosamine-6-phosphate deacetylase n=1 Tax=Robertmurraya TaxID=2837507 RepID=UPI0039A6729F